MMVPWLRLCLLALCVHSAAGAEPSAPTTRDAKGLLLGAFNADEPTAKTREEAALSLKAYPGVSQQKAFWLYVPTGYGVTKPAPLVCVLHHRGLLRRFNMRMVFGEEHLREYAATELATWKDLAEKEGFLLAIPIGDPDILWMGVSWRYGDRQKLFENLLAKVKETHAFDPTRVYVAATGEGAHAAIATAVRRGDMIAAVAAANPPLFDGESRRGNKIFPETVPEMLKESGKRRPPILILAGNADKGVNLGFHSNTSVAACRVQDDGSMSAEHLKMMSELLKASNVPVEFQEIPGRHYAPFPADQVQAAWEWLKKHRVEKNAE